MDDDYKKQIADKQKQSANLVNNLVDNIIDNLINNSIFLGPQEILQLAENILNLKDQKDDDYKKQIADQQKQDDYKKQIADKQKKLVELVNNLVNNGMFLKQTEEILQLIQNMLHLEYNNRLGAKQALQQLVQQILEPQDVGDFVTKRINVLHEKIRIANKLTGAAHDIMFKAIEEEVHTLALFPEIPNKTTTNNKTENDAIDDNSIEKKFRTSIKKLYSTIVSQKIRKFNQIIESDDAKSLSQIDNLIQQIRDTQHQYDNLNSYRTQKLISCLEAANRIKQQLLLEKEITKLQTIIHDYAPKIATGEGEVTQQQITQLFKAIQNTRNTYKNRDPSLDIELQLCLQSAQLLDSQLQQQQQLLLEKEIKDIQAYIAEYAPNIADGNVTQQQLTQLIHKIQKAKVKYKNCDTSLTNRLSLFSNMAKMLNTKFQKLKEPLEQKIKKFQSDISDYTAQIATGEVTQAHITALINKMHDIEKQYTNLWDSSLENDLASCVQSAETLNNQLKQQETRASSQLTFTYDQQLSSNNTKHHIAPDNKNTPDTDHNNKKRTPIDIF